MNKLKSLFNFLFSKKDIQDSKSLEINIRTKKDFEFHFPSPDPDSDVWDVFAAIIEPVVIHPGECKWIPLGFYCDMPQGHVFELKSIFSLTIDKYITVVSAPIVDHLYRDEVGVVLTNFGKYDRICKMLLYTWFLTSLNNKANMIGIGNPNNKP